MFDIATRFAPALPNPGVQPIRLDWCLLRTHAAPEGGDEAALALEETLQTAIVISLFTDARAGQDDQLPRGQTDKRGWCGEEFIAPDAAPWGSKLWLLPAKAMPDVLERARFAAQEALAWLITAGLAQRVSVEVEWHGNSAANQRLALRVAIYRGEQIKPVYDVLWGTSIARGHPQLQTSLYAGDAPRKTREGWDG